MEVLGVPITSATASMSLQSDLGCRPTTGRKHAGPGAHRLPSSYEAVVTQNVVAHIEVLSKEMHPPARAFWKNRNPATEELMRGLLTIETTCFHHRHGAGQPERVSAESWTLDQVLLDAPAMPRSNSTFSTTIKQSVKRLSRCPREHKIE